MTFGGDRDEDRYSTCSEVSSVQDLEDPPPNMLGTLLSEIYTQVLTLKLNGIMFIADYSNWTVNL